MSNQLFLSLWTRLFRCVV